VGLGIHAEASEEVIKLLPHLGVAASLRLYLGLGGGVEFT
jgi:hypothetical protein